MCAPTYRGAAYIAASVFIYRSLLLVVTSISCAITGYKMTYLDVPYLEEFMLHLIYFIPLFTSSGFALMGVEECSFNYVFFSTLALTTTLFVRYGAELSYIYAFDWTAFQLKVPYLVINIFLDSIFILILFCYAYQELRDPVKKEKAKLLNNRSYSSSAANLGDGDDRSRTMRRGKTGTATTSGSLGSLSGPLLSSTPTNNSNVHNEFERKNVKNSNLEAAAAAKPTKKVTYANAQAKGKGIGCGAKSSEALHYPITPLDEYSKMKPLPSLPAPATPKEYRELDDISLPPPVPLASPEYDYV